MISKRHSKQKAMLAELADAKNHQTSIVPQLLGSKTSLSDKEKQKLKPVQQSNKTGAMRKNKKY